jgi:hypothetical protein
VTGLKGPLEEGWEQKVRAVAARIPVAGAAAPARQMSIV